MLVSITNNRLITRQVIILIFAELDTIKCIKDCRAHTSKYNVRQSQEKCRGFVIQFDFAMITTIAIITPITIEKKSIVSIGMLLVVTQTSQIPKTPLL